MEASKTVRQARMLDARSRRALLRASQRDVTAGEHGQGPCAEPDRARDVG